MSHAPEVIFSARARTWTFLKSKAGHWYLRIDFILTEAPHEGERVSASLSFTNDGQARRSFATLRALGGTSETPADYLDSNGGLDRNVVRVVRRHQRFGDQWVAVADRVVLPTECEDHERFQESLRAPSLSIRSASSTRPAKA